MPKLALCLVIAEIGGGMGPIDPGFGVTPPTDPGYGRPEIPGLPGMGGPGIDNTLPGGGAHPWLPGHLGGRPHPGHGLPRPPVFPTHPIYRPDKPVPPGTSPGAGMWVIAFVPGQGFKWVSVTPGVPEKPQPPTVPTDPAHPDNTLPAVPVDPDAPQPAPV
jgi:hypothetical protein